MYIWLRFADRLSKHNAEFNPCCVVDPSRKRASDPDSPQSKRQKLEGLEEVDLSKLMKAGPTSIAHHQKYMLLLAQAAHADSAGTVWIASKSDLYLDVDDILFSFGAGRCLEPC